MLELGDGPLSRGVALRAVLAEQPDVPVLCGVASNAIEGLARSARVEVIGDANAQPLLQRVERGVAGGISARGAAQGPCADLGERHMVHGDGADVRALVLDVTGRALLDARVERGGLTSE